MPDERPNGGRTLGAGGYADHIGGATARQLRILSASAITRATPPSAAKRAIDIRACLEREAPLSAPGFSSMIERAAIAADLGIKAHAHMLRHACGYNRQRWPRYARDPGVSQTPQHPEHDAVHRLAPQRFKEFFRD